MRYFAMITALHLNNYKSFKQLDLDLKKGNRPKKMVAIYGENGSGKSNIVSAFQNLVASLKTVSIQAELAKVQAQNMDESEGENRVPNFVLELIRNGTLNDTDLLSVFRNTYMFQTDEPMRIKYDFSIDGKEGYYEFIFKKHENKPYLSSEKLYFLIKKSSGILFQISNDDNGGVKEVWSPSLFKNNEIKKLTEDATSRLWGKHTFLSIFNNITHQTNKKYIEDNISNNFLAVLNEFNTIAFKSDRSTGINMFGQLLQNMMIGQVPDDENQRNRIKSTENSLRKYFIPLYSDIMDIFYNIISDGKDTLRYELYEKKRIGGEILEIPFKLESHGTRQLLELFPLFLNAVHGETVVIDEIDQGIHDLLIDRLIENIKDDIEGQLIFTTHDTQVMKELDPTSLYIIQIDSEGNKRVVNVPQVKNSNITAHNNIQKKYLEGYFSGIPYSDDVDFFDILEDLEVR